ncbi:hypothetical protein HMN09_01318000 [Mycena chlorophos]|uniref:Uncharacterized protein n=1 Tax=Mycena chlorophos TaxID=658473 RepID=A0A8H6RZQ0_MYCCL|nr:hypothetical protein HMN09_01318000 [Mycena chlorophos]
MASRQYCEHSPPSTAQILARRAPHLFTESANWGTPSVQQQLSRSGCRARSPKGRSVSPLNPSSSSSFSAPVAPQRPIITLSRIPIPIPHFPHDPPPKRRLYAPVPGLERTWDTIGAKAQLEVMKTFDARVRARAERELEELVFAMRRKRERERERNKAR